jgi:hypothetical protein
MEIFGDDETQTLGKNYFYFMIKTRFYLEHDRLKRKQESSRFFEKKRRKKRCAQLGLGRCHPPERFIMLSSLGFLVSPVGVEPTAVRLKVECSTTELQARRRDPSGSSREGG